MTILLALAGTAVAQSPLHTTSSDTSAPLDKATVEAFVDETMAEALGKTYAPGAIVTVVEGDRLILAKGYGYANAETHAPIDPARTLFRIASITKVLTAVAALRLEEQGKLDIDADVNRYLTQFQIPATYLEPITSRRLMTHHGGLDTAVPYITTYHDDTSGTETPEQMSWDMRRARPVTAVPLYDSSGFGLLGLVVADVLGTTYREAMRQEIFEPLRMTQTVSGLPDDRVADAAHAHMRDAQWHAALIPHAVGVTSSQGGGVISTTAEDMGRFMSALLVPGKLLQAPTLTRLMDTDTWRFHPRIPGLGYAIWQYFYHDHLAVGHRGEVNGFISRMALFRDHNIGVFISVDSTVQLWPQPRFADIPKYFSHAVPPPGARTLDPDHLIDGFIDRFADRFLPPLPPPPSDPEPMTASEPTVGQLAGVYFRRDSSTFLLARMFATVFGQRLQALPGGQFATDGCRPFVRKGPLYYECAMPEETTVKTGFRVEDGNRLFVGQGPVGAQERQSWWLTAPFTIWPIPILVLIGMSAFVVRAKTLSPSHRRVLLLAGTGATIFLVALLLELQFAYDLSRSPLQKLILLWRVFFPISAVLILASAVLTLPALRSETGASLAAGLRVGYHLALALSCLGLLWIIWIWDLAWPFY